MKIKHTELFQLPLNQIHDESVYRLAATKLWSEWSIILLSIVIPYGLIFSILFVISRSYRTRVRTEFVGVIKLLDSILGQSLMNIGHINWWPLLSEKSNVEVTMGKPAIQWTCVICLYNYFAKNILIIESVRKGWV